MYISSTEPKESTL